MTFDPYSDKTMGYHLFLEPQGILREELSVSINALAAQHGSPTFAPHVTLLARIPEANEAEVIRKAEALAASLRAVTLTLGELCMEDAYYRALYSRIQEQDSMRVVYGQACEAFGMEKNPEYLAHLSLLYGNYPALSKEKARASVVLPSDRSFSADALHLYRTEGEVGKWKKINSFPIGTS